MPKNNIAGEVFRVEWTELDYSKHSHKDTVSQITGLLLDLYLTLLIFVFISKMQKYLEKISI